MTEQAKFAMGGEENENEPLVRTRQPAAYGYMYPSSKSTFRKKRTLWILLVLVLVVLVVALIVGIGVGVGVANSRSSQLYDSIQIENLMSHLKGLEDIAKNHGNSRAVMNGYNDSADMVYDKLHDAGYTNLTKQYFKVATYEDLGGHTLSATGPINDQDYTFDFVYGSQFVVMRYSGSTEGEISGELDIVTGCEEDNFTSGMVAIIDYGSCPSLFDVAQLAKNANVTALLMARTGDGNAPNARIFKQTADEFEVVDLPMLGVSYQAGKILKDFSTSENGGVNVSLFVNMTVDYHVTYNVLAYTNGGATDSIIVFGSHLDSVPAGPGINDNGSGSSANLEIALQMINSGTNPENQVLFAFWAVEEWGLLGSHHYVKNLPEESREDIALNLNFDMIGSPNYVRQVYNGSGAENENVVEASTIIQELFEESFRFFELNYELTPFTGRSDYGPFIEEGVDIPAGGLFTGADEVKTDVTRDIYGGFANAILDPCYHQYCDDVENIDQEVFQQMARVAAYVLDKLMMKQDLRAFLNPSDFDYEDNIL